MSENYKIREYNCETGETIDRDATEAEIKQIIEDEQIIEKYKKEESEKLARKAELLAKLGISEEEAKLLLS